MATSIKWPSDLPIPMISGLGANYVKAVIRTEMDAGPAKQRQRFTAVPKVFSCKLILTEEKRKVLDSFFTDSLGFGTLRFKMKNPQTGIIEEFRFTDEPTETGNDSGLWEITLPLERLP